MQEKSSDPRLAITSAKAYLIGGVPRTGKTSIARAFITARPMFCISTDSIRTVQRGLVSRAKHPELFNGEELFNEHSMRELCANGQAYKIIDAQNAESEIVWRSVKDYIESTVAEGFDVVVEGVALLPKLINELNCDYKAIFVGNSSLDRSAMQSSAHSDPLDWMHDFRSNTFPEFSKFTALHSEYFRNEAEQNGLKYLEIHEESFEQDISSAVTYLAE